VTSNNLKVKKMEFGEIDNKAALMAIVVELIVLISFTFKGMGWEATPFWIKASTAVVMLPAAYFVSQRLINK
jgi:hypothetical protein